MRLSTTGVRVGVLFSLLASGLCAAPAAGQPPDQTPPVVSSFTITPATFYPYPDGYLDHATARFTATDDVSSVLDTNYRILDSTRTTVYNGNVNANDGLETVIVWRGTVYGGTAAPGTYSIEISPSDNSGNITVETRTVTVSGKKLVPKTLRRTVRAGASITETDVGACSRLRRPSLRGWTGSVGYYSNSRCARGFDASVAAAAHGIYVPRSFQNRYGSLTIKAYGGAATARPRSQGLLQYYRADREWVQPTWLGRRVRTHLGPTVSATRFVHDRSTDPFVIWSAMTAVGHRYDIRDFTVVLTYTVLE